MFELWSGCEVFGICCFHWLPAKINSVCCTDLGGRRRRGRGCWRQKSPRRVMTYVDLQWFNCLSWDGSGNKIKAEKDKIAAFRASIRQQRDKSGRAVLRHIATSDHWQCLGRRIFMWVGFEKKASASGLAYFQPTRFADNIKISFERLRRSSKWKEAGRCVLQRCLRHCSPRSQLYGRGLWICDVMAGEKGMMSAGSTSLRKHSR